MHIWHHAYEMPEDRKYGINFGISLSLWDYIFGTAHIPHNGRDIKLGFPGLEKFPKHFCSQITHGFKKQPD
jgi:sterol desaturase/sphingolipid hydroxylase (fatty acid hydroxylase superfamily)